MATYYVRPASDGGSDAAAGTAIGTAWATIDKAANTVTAGDTVWIKPAVYRELVTMDTSGSSGSSITYNGDFDGAKFGTVGPVIISAWDDDTSTPTRASCWDMNGKTFIVVNKIQFHGGTDWAVGNTAFASATAYEGCEFNDCVMQSSVSGFSFRLEINAGATPATNGLTVRRTVIMGRADVDWDSNGSANVNLKWLFSHCFISGISTTAAAIDMARVTNGGAFTVGGLIFNHCIFFSCNIGMNINQLANTTDPFEYNNCRFVHCGTGVQYTGLAAGAAKAKHNLFTSCITPYTNSTGLTELPDTSRLDVPTMIGGLHDLLYLQVFGWSPFKPWEPINVSGIYTDPAIDYATLDITVNADMYGNFAMGRPSLYTHLYYFDGSDAAATDPNAVWATETNITDTSLTTFGTVNTTGSTSSNYVMAEGTNAPSSGATIATVYVRMHHKWASSNASNAAELKIYTDALGELLATVTQSTTGTTAVWTNWIALTTPSGGWTWTKVQALEFKAYRTAGSTTFQISQIQVYVATAENAPDAGMVEANTVISQKTSSPIEGTISGQLSGAGYQDFIGVPVNASSTTITVKAKYDANYTGTLPQLIVMNIPGVADQTDTMVAAANTEETLSVTFTPTSKGVVRVRIKSNDTSATGTCHFDTLTRT